MIEQIDDIAIAVKGIDDSLPGYAERLRLEPVIEAISSHITPEPGDDISAGTPAGIGTFRNPPVFLLPGDRAAVEMEGVGRLENEVSTGW